MPHASPRTCRIILFVCSGIVALAMPGCARRSGTTGPALAAAGANTCRATTGGVLDCWGMNDRGQVGNGRTASAATVMSTVSGLTGVTAVATGFYNHACAVASGTVSCWGDNTRGQLGNGTAIQSSTPVTTSVTNAVDVSAGYAFSCAVNASGRVLCWGDNTYGQFGNGTTTSSNAPVDVGITGASRITAGMGHTCAIVNGGEVRCWGSGALGSAATSSSTTPVVVVGITTADVITAGLTNSCALLRDGTVRCWGPNFHGELGSGNTSSSATPVPVLNVAGATAVAIGGSHGCAVVTNGEVRCWGDNSVGQLGTGALAGPSDCGAAYACSTSAVPVVGITGAVDVAVGDSHSCAAFLDGRVQCWGWNGYGQLGNGRHGNGNINIAREVRPVSATPVAIGAGGNFLSSRACAMLHDGTVKCWGYNGSGQLGGGGTNLIQSTPTAVQNLTNAVSLSVGGHVCVARADASGWCWGSNSFQQIGGGAAQPTQATARQVPGVAPAVRMVAGRNSSCVITGDLGGQHSMRCWGVNNNGQLGVSYGGMPVCVAIVSLPCTGTPQLVPGAEPMDIAGGAEHTGAAMRDGTVKCFGQTLFGQSGPGASGVAIPNITDAIAIAAGSQHSCALRATGAVLCWGRNRFGQLGDGTTTQSSSPRPVTGITNAVAIAAGSDHSCALLGDGTIQCWGDNGVGTLGRATGPAQCANGSSLNACSTTPVTIPSITNASAIASSVDAGFVCAALSDRRVMCWGANTNGELGRGTSGGFSATPAAVVGL